MNCSINEKFKMINFYIHFIYNDIDNKLLFCKSTLKNSLTQFNLKFMFHVSCETDSMNVLILLSVDCACYCPVIRTLSLNILILSVYCSMLVSYETYTITTCIDNVFC